MRVTEVVLHPLVRDSEGAVVELRREAAQAVAHQQRLRQEISAARARAAEIEEQARRTLARGDELLARQLLTRGICALETRKALEAELEDSRHRVIRLLTTLVRTEDRAWGLRGARPIAM